MYLGLWGRFLVLVTGGLVVIIAIFIVACFVGPGCWGFEYLKNAEKNKNKEKRVKIFNKANPRSDPYYWLDNNDYVISESGPLGFQAKITKGIESPICHSKEKVFNIKCAPLLVAPNLYPFLKERAPKLEVKLYYSELGSDGVLGRLTVQIIFFLGNEVTHTQVCQTDRSPLTIKYSGLRGSVTSLFNRDYMTTLDPFVVLEILNNKWSLQKHERIVSTAQTTVFKNSLNPNFDQTFVFDMKKVEMKNSCLKFTIFDNDRFTKVTPLFEKRIYLKDVKNLTTDDHVSFNLSLQEVTGSVGELLFGISYLPTAQRLNIGVMKATNLKYQNCVHSLAEFYPYVRVVMVNNKGKCMKKKKTCFRHADANPVFNHSLIFDLSISNLEQTVFLVLLCTKTLAQLSNSDDSSLDTDVESFLKESRDRVLGSVILGRNVRSPKARDHWVAVMQNPRKTISVWHDLR